MQTKDNSRTVWMLVVAIIVAFFLYISFAGRTPRPRPQPQDEFPSEEAPPST